MFGDINMKVLIQIVICMRTGFWERAGFEQWLSPPHLANRGTYLSENGVFSSYKDRILTLIMKCKSLHHGTVGYASHLWWQHHTWMLALVLVAPFQIQLPDSGQGKQQRIAQVIGPLHPHETGKADFIWLLAMGRFSFSHCCLMENKPMDKSSPSFSMHSL